MADESRAIDRIDRLIIGELRRDGRQSWRELAERVHLSATSTADRVRRLESIGVITGYSARVDGAALGRPLRALIDVSLPTAVTPEQFEADLVDRGDEIVFAAFVTGSADYAIVVECAGAEGLDALIRWLKQLGAAKTESKVVLRDVVG
jgi:Lrp/AsnC family transcriptional regulator, leucine-responsive regulatory protein